MASTTEKLHDLAPGLDLLPPAAIAQILVDGQIEAARAVTPALEAICDAARAMAHSLGSGGDLYYVAAGSSGLMAAADAMELGGTFGISPSRVHIVMAGGLPRSAEMPGGTEDDVAGLEASLSELSSRDAVVTVAASGSTPFTVAAAHLANKAGATTIGIANNAPCPLLDAARIKIALHTPPEVLSGSTRMGAGTAQKIALNTLSTLMAVELGHVFDGMMVNLVADNDKLRKRAAGIVQHIAGADEASATRALETAEGRVKTAILIAAGAASCAEADSILNQTGGNLRQALAMLTRQKEPTSNRETTP